MPKQDDYFSKILADSQGKRATRDFNMKSLNWFRRKVKNIAGNKPISSSKIISQKKSSSTGKILVGRMYHYLYDPKTKNKLPYYDRFPLVFPIEYYDDGFLGLNMHYLSPKLRARLMDKLYATSSNSKLNENTRLRANYKLLVNATKYRLFQPTLKRYLFTHVKSRFIEIPPEEWQIALFLPTERFVKKDKKFVWNQSKKMRWS